MGGILSDPHPDPVPREAGGRRRRAWVLASRAAASPRVVARAVRLGMAALSVAAIGGCATVYPTFATPVREVPATSGALDPLPPEDLVYLQMGSARIPKRTRDGRAWDELGGKAPDPFAIVFLDDREIFRTRPQPNTLEPTWPGGPGGNYRIEPRSTVQIQLFDSNSVRHRPICMVEIARVDEDAFTGRREVLCDSGATVTLLVEPAHAVWGVGVTLEVHFGEVVVTRVEPESPASRAGLAAGARIVAIQGKPVREMAEGEARSLVNANLRTGFTLSLLEADGATRTVKLREGPIYPVKSPDGG